MTRFDKWRHKTLFRFFWTDGWSRKAWLILWAAVMVAAVVTCFVHIGLIAFVIFWGGVIVALSSNLNPAWRFTRKKWKAITSAKSMEQVVPKKVIRFDDHKFGKTVGFADRKKFGRHRIRKCVNCGCIEITAQNFIARAYYRDGHVFKIAPTCQKFEE